MSIICVLKERVFLMLQSKNNIHHINNNDDRSLEYAINAVLSGIIINLSTISLYLLCSTILNFGDVDFFIMVKIIAQFAMLKRILVKVFEIDGYLKKGKISYLYYYVYYYYISLKQTHISLCLFLLDVGGINLFGTENDLQ